MPTAPTPPSSQFVIPPTRAERTLIQLQTDSTLENLAFDGRNPKTATAEAIGTKSLSESDFLQSLSLDPTNYAAGLTDFISIRLKGRGGDGGPLIFKFLINPSTIQVNRQVVDAETLTRGGMQMGVWGDLTDVSMSGITAGRYFAGVLVDQHSEFTYSYNNLIQLISMYENNGCWWEGETTASLGTPITRKQIQLQADVTLTYQNFVWDGCFTDMSIEESSDHPHYCKFSLSFMTWNERFKNDSPWWNSIRNTDYYGHSYENSTSISASSPSSQINSVLSASAANNPQDASMSTVMFGESQTNPVVPPPAPTPLNLFPTI